VERRMANEDPFTAVPYADEPSLMIQIWNSVSAQNAMEIMNIVRTICTIISMYSDMCDHDSVLI